MHINSLPDDVLILILKHICEEEHYRTSYWIGRMSTMAVCRKWRQLSQKMAYKYVSIDYIGKMRTNLDLMTDRMTRYPQGANIWVECMAEDPVKILGKVLTKLTEHRDRLSRVTYLYIHVRFSEITARNSAKSLQDIARDINGLLTGVTTMCCHINTLENDGLVFESALVKHYAPQLIKIEMDSSAMNSNVVFTQSLTNLCIWWCAGSVLAANIDTTNLTSLELACIEDSFNWGVFSQEDDGVIRFPALKNLYVNILPVPMHEFAEDEDEDDEDGEDENEEHDADDGRIVYIGADNSFDYRLDVPQLQYLEVTLLPFACSLLAAIPVAMEISKLSIETTDNDKVEFHGFKMSTAAKQVFEKYYNIGVENKSIDFIEFVNDLQSIDGLVRRGAHLAIMQDLVNDDVHNIQWPQVTGLCINSPISLTDMLILVGTKLPELELLKVYSIKCDILEDGSPNVPELQDASSFSPIECKVESIVYGFDTSNNTSSLKDLCKDFNSFMFSTIGSLKYISFHE